MRGERAVQKLAEEPMAMYPTRRFYTISNLSVAQESNIDTRSVKQKDWRIQNDLATLEENISNFLFNFSKDVAIATLGETHLWGHGVGR